MRGKETAPWAGVLKSPPPKKDTVFPGRTSIGYVGNMNGITAVRSVPVVTLMRTGHNAGKLEMLLALKKEHR